MFAPYAVARAGKKVSTKTLYRYFWFIAQGPGPTAAR